MWVPLDLVRTEPDLAWCLAWKNTLITRLSAGRVITVLQVPLAEWEQHWLT